MGRLLLYLGAALRRVPGAELRPGGPTVGVLRGLGPGTGYLLIGKERCDACPRSPQLTQEAEKSQELLHKASLKAGQHRCRHRKLVFVILHVYFHSL